MPFSLRPSRQYGQAVVPAELVADVPDPVVLAVPRVTVFFVFFRIDRIKNDMAVDMVTVGMYGYDILVLSPCDAVRELSADLQCLLRGDVVFRGKRLHQVVGFPAAAPFVLPCRGFHLLGGKFGNASK